MIGVCHHTVFINISFLIFKFLFLLELWLRWYDVSACDFCARLPGKMKPNCILMQEYFLINFRSQDDMEHPADYEDFECFFGVRLREN